MLLTSSTILVVKSILRGISQSRNHPTSWISTSINLHLLLNICLRFRCGAKALSDFACGRIQHFKDYSPKWMNGQLGLSIRMVLSDCRLRLSLSLRFIVLILITCNLSIWIRVLVHDPTLSVGMKLAAVHVLELLFRFGCWGLLNQSRLIIDVLIVRCLVSMLVQLYVMLHYLVCIPMIDGFSGVFLALPSLALCHLSELHVDYHLGLDLILRFSNSW